MNIREQQEAREQQILSPYATLSINTKGRSKEEEACDIRTAFQRDRDRILHCKSFRRMKHKTQVFLAPEGDHYRTRLTHTLEVAQNARTIARALWLNEDLTEAIALGHDLGHTPFGHAGEDALNKIASTGFKHYAQSLRVVELLENKGLGLNLTKEVRDGILNHPTKGKPATLEGKIVRIADKIAYINHDIDDAIRGGILHIEDIPECYATVLGRTTRERIDTIIHSIVLHSQEQDDICMSREVEEAMTGLRTFMFQEVYTNPKAKGEESKAKGLVTALFHYYMEKEEELPKEYKEAIGRNGDTLERVVCDYIAGMTDRFSVGKYQELFIPKAWKI